MAHYTGKVTYDCREMADKNRDFLPPEMVGTEQKCRTYFFSSKVYQTCINLLTNLKLQVETMRTSANEIVKILFLNPLSKTGNLTVAYSHQMPAKKDATQRSKWGAALVAEKQKAKFSVNVRFESIFFLDNYGLKSFKSKFIRS